MCHDNKTDTPLLSYSAPAAFTKYYANMKNIPENCTTMYTQSN